MGATITGVGKLESTLNGGSEIPGWIESASPDFVVLNLGQVDIELGLPFRKYVKGDASRMQDHMTAFVEAYMKYLVRLDFPAERVVLKAKACLCATSSRTNVSAATCIEFLALLGETGLTKD